MGPGTSIAPADLLGYRLSARGLKLSVSAMTHNQRQGLRRVRRHGQGLEFHSTRPYQPGDDVRNIDWRVTARKQKAYTRVFQEDHENPVFIVVEQSLALRFGSRLKFKSVLACELAALLGWVALGVGERVGGALIRPQGIDHFRVSGRQGRFLHFLDGLCKANASLLKAPFQTPAVDWSAVLEQLARFVPVGATVVVIGDLSSLAQLEVGKLSRLGRSCQSCALHLYDELEVHPPDSGSGVIGDGDGRFRTLNFDRSHPAEERASRHGERMQAWEKHFRACGLAFLAVSGQDNFLPLLKERRLLSPAKR